MKQTKLWSILFAVLWLLQFVAEAIMLYTVQLLDMLPDQYMLLLLAVCLLLWALTGLMLFLGNKNKGGFRRGVSCVLVLAIVLGSAGVTSVVREVYETLHAVVERPTTVDVVERPVYVRVDDPAQTLTEAAEYAFAIVEGYDSAYTQLAIEKIQNTLGREILVTSYPTVPSMVDALFNGEVDAIILNSAYLPILQDDIAYADFETRTRVLCKLELEKQEVPPVTEPNNTEPDPSIPEDTEPVEPPTTEATLPPIVKPEDITNTPFIVYIGGSDTRSATLTTSRNDVNILAVVNPETKQVLLINTPRDYFIPNPAGGGALDKLTHCGIYGIENTMKALTDLYEIRVDYYAQVNFKGFETMIDAIGGVTVYCDMAFTSSENHYYYSEGENFLNGKKALEFARERYAFADGDNARGRNQMKVIKAVLQKLTSGTTILSRYSEIMDSMKGMFKTNLSTMEMGQLVKMQLNDMASWEILSCAAIGYDSYNVTYSAPGMELYVMQPEYASVAKIEGLIDRMVAGEILTPEDLY